VGQQYLLIVSSAIHLTYMPSVSFSNVLSDTEGLVVPLIENRSGRCPASEVRAGLPHTRHLVASPAGVVSPIGL